MSLVDQSIVYVHAGNLGIHVGLSPPLALSPSNEPRNVEHLTTTSQHASQGGRRFDGEVGEADGRCRRPDGEVAGCRSVGLPLRL